MTRLGGRKPAASIEELEQRIEARRLEDDRLRQSLANSGFDGPYETTTTASMLGAPIGSPKPVRYAICVGTDMQIGCGAMVRIDDPSGLIGGEVKDPPIERSIFLHSRYHDALINLAVNVDGKQDKTVKRSKSKGKKS